MKVEGNERTHTKKKKKSACTDISVDRNESCPESRDLKSGLSACTLFASKEQGTYFSVLHYYYYFVIIIVIISSLNKLFPLFPRVEVDWETSGDSSRLKTK